MSDEERTEESPPTHEAEVNDGQEVTVTDHGRQSGLSVEITQDPGEDREQETRIVGARNPSPRSNDFDTIR